MSRAIIKDLRGRVLIDLHLSGAELYVCICTSASYCCTVFLHVTFLYLLFRERMILPRNIHYTISHVYIHCEFLSRNLDFCKRKKKRYAKIFCTCSAECRVYGSCTWHTRGSQTPPEYITYYRDVARSIAYLHASHFTLCFAVSAVNYYNVTRASVRYDIITTS